ncbi:MAG: isoprenylcysteine carboxylmethyltransferase family protein [Alphaproteobacteria bacterium]
MSKPVSSTLNKTRMRDSRILVAATIFAGIFCKAVSPEDVLTHESLELVGYILVITCAIGRIYASAFIGGKKSEQLITWGPYSLCRNPLYFFSLVGAIGIGLLSGSLVASAVICAGFIAIYNSLIRREEDFLLSKFGQRYSDYTSKTPRLWPSFQNYNCPDELVFQPKYLTKAVADAVWWFVPFPLFEIADYLKEQALMTPFINLW